MAPPVTRFRSVALSALMITTGTWPLSGQSIDGSTLDTALGGALGAYSGATLGLIGGLFPCNRTADGRRCVVSSASVGAALGIAMGGITGSQNRSLMIERAEYAAYGAGAGVLVGLVLRKAVHQYGWLDVLTASVVGGAVGAASEGVLMGTGAGAVVGGLAWGIVPGGGVQDFVLFTLAGAAVGGMLDWAYAASKKPGPQFPVRLSIVF